MAIVRVQCITLTCDDCEDPWEDDEGGTPHFDTEDQALAYVGRDGWVIVGDSMRCGPCGRNADCARTGHQWDEWTAGRTAPDVLPHRTRWCDHCRITEYDPPFDELLLFKHAEKEIADAV